MRAYPLLLPFLILFPVLLAACATPATPAATTVTTSLSPDQQSQFRHLTFQAVAPMDSVDDLGGLRRFHEQHIDTGPLTGCGRDLSTRPTVSYQRSWVTENDPRMPNSWTVNSTHLYQGRLAERLIAEAREHATGTCGAWQERNRGDFQFVHDSELATPPGVDAAFGYCAVNRRSDREKHLFCYAYLARNGPGTTMVSMISTGEDAATAERATRELTAVAAKELIGLTLP
ncbi:hypothetical protein [Crossiella sp. NPDC003009]